MVDMLENEPRPVLIREKVNGYCRYCRKVDYRYCIVCKQVYDEFGMPIFFVNRQTMKLKHCMICKYNVNEYMDEKTKICAMCVKTDKMYSPSLFVMQNYSVLDSLYFVGRLLYLMYPENEMDIDRLIKKMSRDAYSIAIRFLMKYHGKDLDFDSKYRTIKIDNFPVLYQKYHSLLKEITKYEKEFRDKNAELI